MKKYSDKQLTDAEFNDLLKQTDETLDLSNNQIYGFSVVNLEKNQYLKTLYLDNNRISQLSIEDFAASLAKNSSITKLSLAYNTLRSEGVSILVDYLSDPSFSKSKIEMLDLSHNSITDLDDQALENIAKLKLKELVLDDNPLSNDETGSSPTLKKLIQQFQNSHTLTLLSCKDAKMSPELFPELLLLAKHKHKLKTMRLNGVNLKLNDQTRDFLDKLTSSSHFKLELWDLNDQICAEFKNRERLIIKKDAYARNILTNSVGMPHSTFFKNHGHESAQAFVSTSREIGSSTVPNRI